MAYTDFIAAIDLGTSRIVGMVGKKNEYGVLSIIAYEVETSASCIRRGCVYNVEETANKIKRLILKLENKLNGTKIAKVYVALVVSPCDRSTILCLRSWGQKVLLQTKSLNHYMRSV